MGRTLSLLAHLPRLEADGLTHRRDCECVRCDAGFRPTEREREAARARLEERRTREAAAQALARRRQRQRLKAAAIELELGAEERAVDKRLKALREARVRADEDGRLALLQSLRGEGRSFEEALREVERRTGSGAKLVGPAGFEPAANGLKVRSSTS